MDALRKVARGRGVVSDKNVERFAKNFMKTVERHGRVFELELTMRYNLATGNPFKDAAFGPKLYGKGRIGLKPHRVKAMGQIKRIFERAKTFVRSGR